MTMLDAGLLTIYKLVDAADPGNMPDEKLVKKDEMYYGERSVGYSRQYAARSVNEQIDMIVRIWQDKTIRAGMYCIPEDGEQYRISVVQHFLDDDGLGVTDLTLVRLGKNYELS